MGKKSGEKKKRRIAVPLVPNDGWFLSDPNVAPRHHVQVFPSGAAGPGIHFDWSTGSFTIGGTSLSSSPKPMPFDIDHLFFKWSDPQIPPVFYDLRKAVFKDIRDYHAEPVCTPEVRDKYLVKSLTRVRQHRSEFISGKDLKRSDPSEAELAYSTFVSAIEAAYRTPPGHEVIGTREINFGCDSGTGALREMRLTSLSAQYDTLPLGCRAKQADHIMSVRLNESVGTARILSPEELKAERQTKRLAIKAKLDKLILPEELKSDIVAQVVMHSEKSRIFDDWGLKEVIEYGRGTILLFYGKPGTGKTYGARKIAEAIEKELIVANYGDMQSSSPGEYEMNLKEKFREATDKGAVLFFDECDGIVQSRQGMGQIMSAENNCFLQQVEAFEGILILATNRVDSLDAAMERRISLIVEFPEPTEELRLDIWKQHIPAKMPLHSDVNLPILAKFELTGGQIKNVVLNAARSALARDAENVALDDFMKALLRVLEGQQAFNSPRATGRRQQTQIVKGPG